MADDPNPTPRNRRVLCVSLHDVAPATLSDCRNTLAFLDRLNIGPVALLVVPDFHGLGRADRDRRFCDFLHARVRRGDEIVLHGYFHTDPHSRLHGLREWIERRVYADREGEFARLDTNVARARLLRGLAVLRSAGWQPSGFVAPAWLTSPGTCAALESLRLRYYATRDHVHVLGAERSIRAPSLVMSTCSPWRRAASVPWACAALLRHLEAPVLRAAFHPRDLAFPSTEGLWRQLLRAMAGRQTVTEGGLVAAL